MHNINRDEIKKKLIATISAMPPQEVMRTLGSIASDELISPPEPTSGCYGDSPEPKDQDGGHNWSVSVAPGINSEISQIHSELDGQIWDYKNALKGQHRGIKATPAERAVLENAVALIGQAKDIVKRAFRAGQTSVTVDVSLRYCPDCPEEVRKPLPFRQRYCDKHRAQRRKITYRLSKRRGRNLSTVSTVPAKSGNSIDMSEKENLAPDEAIKRQIIGLYRAEKLGLYATAKKLGIVEQQVNYWLYKDEWFRLRARHERVLQTTELLLKALELRHTERPLTDREKNLVTLTNPIFANPILLDGMLDLTDPKEKIAKLSIKELQEFDDELSKCREAQEALDEKIAEIQAARLPDYEIPRHKYHPQPKE